MSSRKVRPDHVKWYGGDQGGCEHCGDRVTIPSMVPISALIGFIDGYIAAHLHCRKPAPAPKPEGPAPCPDPLPSAPPSAGLASSETAT